jgi:sugar lactone lactonase YvrE
MSRSAVRSYLTLSSLLASRPRFTLLVLVLVGLVASPARLAADENPPPGTLVVVAGTGEVDDAGDGGPAAQAKFLLPWGMTLDAVGNLYIGDLFAARIRRIGPDGIITTFAGTGRSGFSGDGGPAAQARLGAPVGLTFDAAGNLYVGDAFNHRIRKIAPDGVITTVAGSGASGFGGDGGPATQARLYYPDFPVLDAAGNLYFNDKFNHRVRKVDMNGVISTVAGGGAPADGLGDGGPATQARLRRPYGIALDGAGNLYIADGANRRVRRVAPGGTITTVAGGGNPADGIGDGGPAVQARLLGPVGVAVDPGGNLFVVDENAFRVRKVSPDGTISTVIGTGRAGFAGAGGPATAAGLSGPTGILLDAMGNLYRSDAGPGNSDLTAINVVSTRVLKIVGIAVPR